MTRDEVIETYMMISRYESRLCKDRKDYMIVDQVDKGIVPTISNKYRSHGSKKKR